MKKELRYDVVVIGGGPAGAVAATAAARGGAKTLLVEKNGFLGGALTSMGVGPMMTFHAGATQVVRGIPDELVERMKARGFSPGHQADTIGYASSVTPFDAEGLKLVLEEMAAEAGVELLYRAQFADCAVSEGEGGKRIESVRLLTKGGFLEVRADVFLDCSADADLAFAAGAPTSYGREADGLAQPMTMNAKVVGVDRDAVADYMLANRDDFYADTDFDGLRGAPRLCVLGGFSLVKLAKERGEFDVDRDMVLCFETNARGEFILNMSRVTRKSAVDAFDLTAAEIEGRRQAHRIVAFLRKYLPGFAACRLVATGPEIGIRESRHLKGSYVLQAEDLLSNRMFPDAVAMGGYPIDIHSPDGSSMRHRFLEIGSWYSVPYRSLRADGFPNLLVAGRCLSASHEACAAVRVTPIVMAAGQAAGNAAALCARKRISVGDLDPAELRARLAADGAFLEEYRG